MKNKIKNNLTFEEFYFLNKDEPWNVHLLTGNKNITWNIFQDLLSKHPIDTLSWFSLSMYLPWNDIEKTLNSPGYSWNWIPICKNKTFAKLANIKKYKNSGDLNWDSLSMKCDWEDIQKKPHYPWVEYSFGRNPTIPTGYIISLLKKYSNNVLFFYNLSNRSDISIDILEKEEYRDKWDYEKLSISLKWDTIEKLLKNPEYPHLPCIFFNKNTDWKKLEKYIGDNRYPSMNTQILYNSNFTYEDILHHLPTIKSLSFDTFDDFGVPLYVFQSNLTEEMIDRIVKDNLFEIDWNPVPRSITPSYVIKNRDKIQNFRALSTINFTDNRDKYLTISIQRRYRQIIRARKTTAINIIKLTFTNWYYRTGGKYSLKIYEQDFPS